MARKPKLRVAKQKLKRLCDRCGMRIEKGQTYRITKGTYYHDKCFKNKDKPKPEPIKVQPELPNCSICGEEIHRIEEIHSVTYDKNGVTICCNKRECKDKLYKY